MVSPRFWVIGRGARIATVSVTAAAAALSGGSVGAAAVARAEAPAAGSISTVAGGVGGPGTSTTVAINYPCGLNSAAGKLYVGDGLVQEVNERSDWMTTVAGGARRISVHAGGGGHIALGDRGPAGTAMTSACGTSLDAAGNLVLADQADRQVRVVAVSTGTFYGQQMTAGDIYSIAGTGRGGISGDGGPAVKADMSDPVDVTVDQAGNLVVADSGSAHQKVPAEVQVVAASDGTDYGQQMTAGHIYGVAGSAASMQVSGDGGPAVEAGLGAFIGQVQLDQAGNLVVADTSGNRIRVVAAATGTFYGKQMTAGDIYTVAGTGGKGLSGDDGPAALAKLDAPLGVAADGSGNLVIADTGNNLVRVVAASTGTFYGKAMTAGDIYTIGGCGNGCQLGDGGPALAAMLIAPDAITVDGAGNVIVAEHGVGRISTHRRVRAIAVRDGTFYGQQMTAGDIYTVAGDGTLGYSGDNGLSTKAVMLTTSSRMAVDSAGNLLVAAGENNRIRLVPPVSGTFYGQQMTAGHIYTVAGGGRFPYSGDGGPAVRAGLNFPDGLAIDGHGNLVIADEGNRRIRVVADSTGTFYGQKMTAHDIYTVAGTGTRGFSGDGGPATKAMLSIVNGIAVDGAGNLVLSDDGNSRIRVVAATTGTFYGVPMTAGDIYTVAGDGTRGFAGDGGPATKAELDVPKDVTVNHAGNLVITDQGNSRIRVVADSTGVFYGQLMAAGEIYTVAGTGGKGYSGDGGPATGAELDLPTDLVVDSHGNLIIADEDNNRVRVVAEATGTFYGVPMTAGDIYTVAGDGNPGFSGDGGPATKAELISPTGVVLAGDGDLYVADAYRVRLVAG